MRNRIGRVAGQLLLASVFVVPFRTVVMISIGGFVLNLAWIVGGLLSLVFVLYILSRGMIEWMRPHYVMMIFFWWVALSTLWSHDPYLTMGVVIDLMIGTILVLVIPNVTTRPSDIDDVLKAYVLGCMVTTIIMITMLLSGQMVSRRLSVTGIIITSETLAISIPIAAYCATVVRRRLYRMLFILYIPAAIYGITLTGSRTGLVMAAVSSILTGSYVLIKSRASLIIKAGTLLMILGTPVFVMSNMQVIEDYVPAWSRITDISQEVTTGSYSGRSDIWRIAMEDIQEAPVLGQGAGAFRSFHGSGTSEWAHAHNTVLSLWAEVGFVGLVLFCLLVYSVIPPKGVRASWVMIVVLLTAGVGGLSGSREYALLTWLLLGICVAVQRAANRNDKVDYAQVEV